MHDVTIKIHQGTGRLTGVSLCHSCRYGRRFTDGTGEHEICGFNFYGSFHIHGAVRECNRYYNAVLPAISDMEETAWTLRTEKGGKMIGFTPPEPKDKK